MALFAFVIPVQAAEKQDDNLKVNYVIEKTSEKDAVIKINVQNISNHVLKNINLKNNIPTAFNVEGERKITIESLDSSESKEITINVKLKDKIMYDGDNNTTGNGGNTDKTSPIDDGNNNTTGNGGNKDIISPIDNRNNDTVGNGRATDKISPIDKNKNVKNKQKDKAVKTGDPTEIGRWIIALGISVLVVFGIIKSKKNKSVLSLLLVSTMLLSTTGVVKAADIVNKEIQLKEHFVLNNTDYEFGLDISYEIEKEGEFENPDTITRGEWINRLVNAMDYEELEVTIDKPYFNDTTGTIVENSINYAVANRIVDLESEEFHPNRLASREFIAVTTVKALGFQPQEDLSCADAGDVKDSKNAYLAVKLGIIDLVDNHFYPTGNGTVGMANQALKVVKDVLATTKVGDTPHSNIVYRDGVVVFDENEAAINGTTVTVDADGKAKGIKTGDIIAVKDIACYKVTAVDHEGGKIILSTIEPEMQEAIESMDFEGKLRADFSQFEPAEGVVVSRPKSRIMRAPSMTTPDIGSMPFEIEIPGIDNVKIKGKLDADVTVSTKADVKAVPDWPPIYCKNVMLKLDPDLDVEAGIYAGISEGAIDKETMNKVKKAFANGNRCKGTINLGKVPVIGIPGARIYIEFGLAYDLNGYFKLIWNFDGQVGIQVYENNPRFIYSATSTLTPQLGGEAKVGPELAAVLKTVGYNLIDLATSAGAKGEGDVIFRPNNMICSDLAAYAYWDVSVLKNSKLAEWFKWGWSYDIWDKDNSPIGLDAHFENLVKVPECTYMDATINGVVVDAETNEPIEGAKVKAVNLTNNSVEVSGITNGSGGFTIGVKGGVGYRIETSKDGYITCKEEVKLETDEVKQLQTRMQVRGTDGTTETGKAGGKLSDAQTGGAISSVEIKARKDWGNKTGKIVGNYVSNSSGEYRIEDLPLGNYTLELIKENYVTSYLNIFVTKSGNFEQHGVLNPKSIENDNSVLRVVLTWGQNPSDIDSHLVGLSPTNNKFHIYYSNKEYYENGKLICNLDVDDTSSYGPETITLYKVSPDQKYSFCLHDYSNRYDENSMALSNSSATLTIYVKGKYKRTIHIPTNKVGTQWHAFDYNSGSGTIQLIDEFSNTNDPNLVGE